MRVVKRLTTPIIVTAVGGLVLALGLGCDAVLDVKPPRVKIVSPSDGDSVKGDMLLHVEADDRNLSKLALYLDDSLLSVAGQSPLDAAVDLDTSCSIHRLRAVAYDRGGNWSEDRTTVVRLVPRVSLTLLSTYDTPGSALDFAIAGAYLYAVGDSWLIVLSLANPGVPVEMGRCTGRGGNDSYFCDVHVSGSLVCVADASYPSSRPPAFFDVTDPCSPRLLSSLDTCAGAFGVYCEGGLAYALDFRNDFYVADVSVPAAPVILGSCRIQDTRSYGFGHMVKSGNYIYVTSELSGIVGIDVSNPSMPARVCGLGGSSYQLGHPAIWRDTLYYSCQSYVRITDITSPTNPVDIGSIQVRGAKDMAVDDSLLYVTSWCHLYSYPESLHILSRTDGSELLKVPTTSAEPMSVAVADSFVYVACRDGCIMVYERKQEWVAK